MRTSQQLIMKAIQVIQSESKVKVDYLDICDLDTGEEVETISENGAMISGAIWNGKTRLIDNIILK